MIDTNRELQFGDILIPTSTYIFDTYYVYYEDRISHDAIAPISTSAAIFLAYRPRKQFLILLTAHGIVETNDSWHRTFSLLSQEV